jgi:hypothetical protein
MARLPGSYDLPICWTLKEREWLRGAGTIKAIESQEMELRTLYSQLMDKDLGIHVEW